MTKISIKIYWKKQKSYNKSLRLLTYPMSNKINWNAKADCWSCQKSSGLSNASFAAKIKKTFSQTSRNFVTPKKQIQIQLNFHSNILALELSISNKIGLNVDIQNNRRNKGSIRFEYKDLDQLNKLIDIIKTNY